MGCTKQLVSWANAQGLSPLVAAAYDAIRPICDEMTVVVGHEATAVIAALGDRSFHPVFSDPDAAMFESIRAGLGAAQSTDSDAVMVLQPADHPEVAADTLRLLLASSRDRPSQAVIPEFLGRGGHPVLIPPGVAARILEDDCPTGLGDFWAAHPELCVRVPVSDPGVCRDIDTPGDLAN
jgi:molybdenum cofactor cytidylyltransferase